MQLRIFEDDPEETEEVLAPDYRVERNLARAAEFFVAYDVSRRGWDCFTVGEGLRYDLIADVRGIRRIQVKSSRRASARDYMSAGSKSGYKFGDKQRKTGLRDYDGDVDLFAFVAMDRLVVLYALPASLGNSLWVPCAGMTSERSDLSWAAVMRGWGTE